ncbi:MAG: hypothetical protein EP349_09895 [Alphaproteobacteria bacterium]|nr:MAG: hypothetical protein EP349_09895 [Alphaproteobacteria bacterium]
MSAENLKYQAKNIGYHVVDKTNNDFAHWVVGLTAAAVLPFMAITGNIGHEDMDTQGLANSETVMAELQEQKADLLTQVTTYNKLKGDQAAYEQLGQRDKVLELADDVMATEYSIKDAAQAFFGSLYTNGGTDGLAISETDFKNMLTDLDAKDGDFDWSSVDESLPNMINTAAVAEHLDEARSTVSVPDNADMQTRFSKAAEISQTAISDDDSGQNKIGLSLLFGSWIPGLLMAFLFAFYRDEYADYARKPQKPKPKASH